MENNYIFAPVLVQVALTLWLYIYLAIAKSRAVKAGSSPKIASAISKESSRRFRQCWRHGSRHPSSRQ